MQGILGLLRKDEEQGRKTEIRKGQFMFDLDNRMVGQK